MIDQALAQVGLNTTLRDGLKKFPGCIHWHAKNGGQPGTLEITLWPQQQRAWFTIQDGRAAGWIDAKLNARCRKSYGSAWRGKLDQADISDARSTR